MIKFRKMFAQINPTEWTESQSFRGPQGYRLPSIDTVMAGRPLSIILGILLLTMDIIVCYVISFNILCTNCYY